MMNYPKLLQALLTMVPYKTENPVFPYPKRVAVTGLPRSGSTYVWQVLANLVQPPDRAIIKGHGYLGTPRIVCVATIRHPIQALCSWLIANGAPCTLANALKILPAWQTLLERFHVNRNTCHVLRYEEFVDNPTFLFDRLETIFELRIDDALREKLTKNHSRSNNEAIGSKVLSFARFDPGTLIHGNHVTRCDDWRKMFSESDQIYLVEALKTHLINFGYMEEPIDVQPKHRGDDTEAEKREEPRTREGEPQPEMAEKVVAPSPPMLPARMDVIRDRRRRQAQNVPTVRTRIK